MSEQAARAVDSDGPRSVRLPFSPHAVPRIRRLIVEDLAGRDVGVDVVEETEVVVAELVSNALRHAKPLNDGTVRVRWKVKSGAVEVEVSDGGGPSTPRPAPPAVWATSGRGLRIVRSLAHEWGVTEDKQGRTVWAALGGPSRRRSH